MEEDQRPQQGTFDCDGPDFHDPRVATIRVKAMHNKRIYRDIEFGMDTFLDEVAECIVDAFGWDCDHCYGFYGSLGYRVRGSAEAYELFFDLSREDGVPYQGPYHFQGVKDSRVRDAFGVRGKKMQFLFDYGEDYRFELEVRSVADEGHGLTYPRITASKGEMGDQYPAYDDGD